MIIPAEFADAPELTMLVNGAYRGKDSHAGWTTEADFFEGTRTDLSTMEEHLRKPEYHILKYMLNGNIAGCVELHPVDGKLYLGMLTVNPQLQNSGIGKQLLTAAEKYAVEEKFSAIFMTVISIRTELMNWYHRHGYSHTGKSISFADAHGASSAAKPKLSLELVVLEKVIVL